MLRTFQMPLVHLYFNEILFSLQFCKNNQVPVHSIMTQFAQALDDPVFTKQQYDMYLKLVEPYRYKCLLALLAHAKAGRSFTLCQHRERFFQYY